MKIFTQTMKIAACVTCKAHEKQKWMAGYYKYFCHKVGAYIEQIGRCSTWEEYWKDLLEKEE